MQGLIKVQTADLPEKARKKVKDDKEVYIRLFSKEEIDRIKEKMKKRAGLNAKERKIAIEAGLIDPEQEWFWTPGWQRGEKEADEDIRKGRVSKIFESAEEAIAQLKKGKL